jgi:hypothetical protein
LNSASRGKNPPFSPSGALPIENRRYGRLEICATGVAAIIVVGNSQICFHKIMTANTMAKTNVHTVMHALRSKT